MIPDEEKTIKAVEKGLSQQNTHTGSVKIGTIVQGDDNRANNHVQRHLSYRQVQLIAIGGSIGTANFVTMGAGLMKGGPANLLIAYAFYSCMVSLVNNSIAEMAVFMPVSAAFIRMAGRWVDPAFGFLAGWNFFIYEVVNIPFEISAISAVLKYWRDDIPVAAVVSACIVLYLLLNIVAVNWFGEAEFWLAAGKVNLILIVYAFTFITMVGGNPKHDAYGFRYWKTPGAFAEYIHTGDLGHFEGFLGCLWNAAFTVVGPEYVSMLSGETKLPRRYIKSAFKATYARFALFFVGSALCVGIVVAYNDPTLTSILGGSSSGATSAAASPYVIAMSNLGVNVLPHVTNALLITSIFSAGNAYTFYASRILYGLALEGQAPKFLVRCTKSGIPVYALGVVMVFPCLAFLNVSSSSASVLTWLTNVITGAGIINYIIISVTYIFFYNACKVQNIDRMTLPYCGWFQPYSAWTGALFMTTVVCVYGYSVFVPGMWSVASFFTYYTMVLVAPILYFGWKIARRTKFVSPEEADLSWERPLIDEYEAAYIEEAEGFWTNVLAVIGLAKKAPKERSTTV
ncbi:amino acid permease/ SLC12A domain-containing protein [Hypoxylon sp. NC0597]|nr:amino acid permease/ SLC12A domain-containing protein [Hypoxylon sp. NC0597]